MSKKNVINKNKLSEREQFHNFLWVVVIFVSLLTLAFFVVQQVYNYRHDYKIYNKLIRERDAMMVERSQLLIEQQTFGATSQIGARAVTQLRMFSPPIAKTVIMVKEQPLENSSNDNTARASVDVNDKQH